MDSQRVDLWAVVVVVEHKPVEVARTIINNAEISHTALFYFCF